MMSVSPRRAVGSMALDARVATRETPDDGRVSRCRRLCCHRWQRGCPASTSALDPELTATPDRADAASNPAARSTRSHRVRCGISRTAPAHCAIGSPSRRAPARSASTPFWRGCIRPTVWPAARSRYAKHFGWRPRTTRRFPGGDGPPRRTDGGVALSLFPADPALPTLAAAMNLAALQDEDWPSTNTVPVSVDLVNHRRQRCVGAALRRAPNPTHPPRRAADHVYGKVYPDTTTGDRVHGFLRSCVRPRRAAAFRSHSATPPGCVLA